VSFVTLSGWAVIQYPSLEIYVLVLPPSVLERVSSEPGTSKKENVMGYLSA
jgi:hypothetical protein